MDPTISVSKGCFVFKNGATRADKKTKTTSKRKREDSVGSTGVLGKEVTSQPFYEVYASTWRCLQTHIEQLQQRSYARTLEQLVDYLANANSNLAETYGMAEILPTAALLTGINQPDHLEQFETLTQRINEKISASICVLQSRDCPTLKAAVEALVFGLVESSYSDAAEDRDHKRLRRLNCTIKQLKYWYRNNYPLKEQQEGVDDGASSSSSISINSSFSHTLIVILPDFESFNSKVLQDLILILSSHCAQLPFVLVLGIATQVAAVHNTLPYHVTSKIKLRVFQTQAAPDGLNEILESVILSPKYAFHLSGKTFKFLTHIFLYYDFSISGFIQGFKYCLMEHYFHGNAYSLCTSYAASLKRIQTLTHDDMETIRRLLSFRPYVEGIDNCKRIIAILTDDDYLKRKLPQLLRDCHLHFILLRTFLEFLAALVDDLPKCPLGKQRRELYAFCLAKDICAQPEYKECWQILAFMSKKEFAEKINKAITTTQDFVQKELVTLELGVSCATIVSSKLKAVEELLLKVTRAGLMESQTDTTTKNNASEQLQKLASRHDLKERLLKMSKVEKPTSEYTKTVNELLTFIQNEIVANYLKPLQQAPPLHELFVFTDIATVRRHIIGAPRSALHMALNNPHFYLQCKCCQLRESTQLLATLPDLSIVYKLHLECGRMINLFDWLQAFNSLVDPNDDDQQTMDTVQIDPQIQARFTRAVAELQFLGYIKTSNRKTDHVTRLTW